MLHRYLDIYINQILTINIHNIPGCISQVGITNQHINTPTTYQYQLLISHNSQQSL